MANIQIAWIMLSIPVPLMLIALMKAVRLSFNQMFYFLIFLLFWWGLYFLTN